MAETEEKKQEEGVMMYVVGAIIAVAVVVASILMWPRQKSGTQTTSPTPEQNVVSKPQLTKLACENQWYNPVIGIPKFYLSAEGGDVLEGKTVECTFTLTKDKDVILTEKITGPMTVAPERGGTTFRCTSKSLENIPQGVPLKMTTTIKNEGGQTASCSGMATFKSQ